jgi:hypothetical protein
VVGFSVVDDVTYATEWSGRSVINLRPAGLHMYKVRHQ